MIAGWGLLTITCALVLTGMVLYDSGLVGWAQLLWVLASGTAGASVMSFVDQRRDDHRWDTRGFWDE